MYNHQCRIKESLLYIFFAKIQIHFERFLLMLCLSFSKQVPLESIDHLTRIHYSGDSDVTWCEHELDHILICRRDVTLIPNTDEIQQTMYLGKNELKKFLRTTGQKNVVLTPWFRYIANSLLFEWWDNLDDLSMYRDAKIHRAGRQ